MQHTRINRKKVDVGLEREVEMCKRGGGGCEREEGGRECAVEAGNGERSCYSVTCTLFK